jgi:hypothetical protein
MMDREDAQREVSPLVKNLQLIIHNRSFLGLHTFTSYVPKLKSDNTGSSLAERLDFDYSRYCTGSRSSFKVRTVSCAAERPVRGLNLDRETGTFQR